MPTVVMARLSKNSGGFRGLDEVGDTPRPRETRGAGDDGKHSLSAAWITDELRNRTQQVWSRVYGRPINERETQEILLNVKRFAEVLLKIAETGETR